MFTKLVFNSVLISSKMMFCMIIAVGHFHTILSFSSFFVFTIRKYYLVLLLVYEE